MNSENLMGKRVELVVHLKDQYLRLRRGERGTVTGQFRDGFNVPLRVLWDNGTNWSVHYDEVQLIDDAAIARGTTTTRAAAS
ncbi:MAG: hypothetical protein ABW298_04480 [Candidatus Binatia bacterium]|jgi:hypothetical protein